MPKPCWACPIPWPASPLTMLSVGIGVGAILVGRLSPSRVEYGLIPLGAIGVFLTLLVLGLITPKLGGTVALMLVLGMASGLVFIPLNALIQWRAPADRRGSVIALENTCVFAGIMLGSLAGGALGQCRSLDQRHFCRDGSGDLHRHIMGALVAARRPRAIGARDPDTHDVPGADRRARTRSASRRSAARPESRLIYRWTVAGRKPGPAYSVRRRCAST